MENIDENLFLYNYTVKDGLSESIVNAIFVDSRGLAWIGTEGGLNKFNGYTFDVYKEEDTSQYALSHSRIYSITEDEFGNIWVGTANGLNKYLPEVDGFQHKVKTGYDLVEKMLYDPSRKSLWLAMANQGLVEYHIPTDTFKPNKILSENELVSSVIQINEDSLVVGTQESGVFQLNLKTGNFHQISTNSEPLKISNNEIQDIAVKDNYLIVGTNKGVNFLDFGDFKSKVFSKRQGNFSSDLIVSVRVDSQGLIWVGTDGGGLNRVNPKDFSITNFVKAKSNENGLQTNVIKTIYEDKDQNLWLGTNKYGFSIYNKKTSFLNNINLGSVDELNLKSNSATSFQLDSDGSIFIGTDGGGLLRCDGQHFEKISLDPNCKDCHEEKILALEKDEKGSLWIGTYADGLYCLKNDGKILHFKNDDKSGLKSNNIWRIKSDKKGYLWLATDTGLVRLNLETYEFKSYIPYIETDPLAGKELRCIEIDDNDKIWTGSFSGLHCFNPETEKFEKHFTTETNNLPLVSNVIISIYRDDNNHLWLGTYGKGIQAINPYEEKIIYQNLTNQIGNKMALFVQGDSSGNIWAGTNSGILTINPEKENFYLFDTNNGLQDDEYNMNACEMINDSILIAGGTKGFVLLNTNRLIVQHKPHKVILEKISCRNQFLPFNPYSNRNDTPHFTIDYSRSGLNISFAALDFGNAKSIKYSYLLENFDKEWSKPDYLRQANYTNLPPGSYSFKVKTEDPSQNEEEAQILATITVKPSWWMTIWFKIFLSLLIVGAVLLFTKIRNNRLKSSKVKLIKAVAEKTKEIEDQKEEIEHKKFEIELRNNELMEQNMELQSMNEELNAQKETIDEQRKSLETAHLELQKINSELEEMVKERTSELNNTINELNKTISELDRFVYSASHDLGAPLKSILGLINIAKLETKDEGIKPHLKFMKDSVHKLEDVIQSLIQYSRNSRMELHPIEISLSKFICDSFDTLKFMPGFEKIHFNNEIDKSKKVIADENRLKIIVRNLLSNAIKYSDPEKEEQWIKVRYHDLDKSHWQLIVEDNGLGIDNGHLEKIFKMFYRANESSDGSGLGLYITKEAITKLNGDVHVESTLHKGTSVFVTLSKYY